jgi:hypothetical protein
VGPHQAPVQARLKRVLSHAPAAPVLARAGLAAWAVIALLAGAGRRHAVR